MTTEPEENVRMSAPIEDLPREIGENVYWLGGCNTSDGYAPIHLHVNAFLVVGRDRTLLYDTGAPDMFDEIERQLFEAMGDRRLDYVVPSHAEVPHCGNLERLLRKYPDAKAVGDLRDFHIYFPAVAHRFEDVAPGHEIDLGGCSFLFVDAPVEDARNTVWGYVAPQQVLFCSDGFGFVHRPPADEHDDDDEVPHSVHLAGECGRLTHELDSHLPSVEQGKWLTVGGLYWVNWVPVEPFIADTRRLLERLPTRVVAPAHSHVVTDLDRVMPIIEQAYRDVHAGILPQAEDVTA